MNTRNSNCVLCPLHEGVNTVCLWGRGNLNADIMFVGEAPGADEDRLGEPFVGAAGQILTNILKEFKIERKKVYISNSVKCRPPNNRRPRIKEVRACTHYLLSEINQVKPKLIIALGQLAGSTLLDQADFRVTVSRGKVFYSSYPEAEGIPIVVTYHPAAIKRDNTLIESVFQDFSFFMDILKNGIKERKKCVYKKGVSQVKKRASIDLETTGLNPFNPGSSIICVATTNRSHSGYCTTHIEKVRDIVANPDILKIGHNIKFDIKWFVTHGFKFNGQIHDTIVGEHLLNENLPSYGLKELAAVYTDMGAYSAKLERQLELVGHDPSKVPISTLMDYCSQDVDAAMRFYKAQIPRLKEEGLMPLFGLTMEGEMVMARAEIRGVNIDKKRHEVLHNKYETRIDELREEIKSICGTQLDNPNSGVQLAKVLVGKMGLPALKRTKTGKVSVDEEALKKMLKYDRKGIIKLILRYRNLRGDYTKYLTPARKIWQEDGRVHCEFKIHGTKTGRYSCKNPNLQQVPRESQIKSMFISTHKNGKILQVDYDQGEYRLLAHLSQDRFLLSAFESKEDIHKRTASQLFKVKYENVTDKQRYDAKQLNFSIIYGMGVERFAAATKMRLDDASHFMQSYKDARPGVKQYILDRENEILERGYVENLFGRRRRIPIIDLDDKREVKHAQRQAVNAPIQSALHDINILATTLLDRSIRNKGYTSRIILVVHDSIVLDCPNEEVNDIKKLAKEICENLPTSAYGFELTVPMNVSIGVGSNWKEASEND